MPIYSGGGGGSGSVPALAAATVSLTSGNITTVSTTFVDLTGVTVTLSTGARRALVVFNASASNSTAGNACYFDIAIDGTRQGGTNGLIESDSGSNGLTQNASFTYLTPVLTSASHTIKIQWRVNANTGTVVASTTSPVALMVAELLQTT